MDFIFLWLITFVLGFWIFKKINAWKSLPPGPWGLPILGYLPFIDRLKPHVSLTELSQRYGSIYGIDMGSVYAVVLSDHKLVRDAFSKEVFSGRAPLYLTHGIMKGNGIICAEGALWKDQRKLISLWLKSFGMSKHSAAREKLLKRIVAGVEEILQNVRETSGSAIDLSEMVSNSLGNVVNDVIFGFKFPPQDKTWQWFRHIQEEGCKEMGVAGIVNFLPFVRFLSPSIQKTMETMIRGQAQTHRLYASIIARRRKMLGLEIPKEAARLDHTNIYNEHPDGFVKCIKYSTHDTKPEVHYFDPSVLISSKAECILDSYLMEQKRRCENGEENAYFMRDEQLHHLLADMFGAGIDTTTTTMSWYFLYMSLNPEEQEKVRTEILTVYPEETDVDISKLPYLMASISETQRIRTVAPVGIPHGCVQDTYLANYKIPKGAMIIPLQWAIHMDPNIWEDPEDFRPKRFLDEEGNLLKPQELVPFQTGKRMCPGDELFRMIAVELIVRFMRSFRVRFAQGPPSAEEMQGTVGFTLSAPNALFICEKI